MARVALEGVESAAQRRDEAFAQIRGERGLLGHDAAIAKLGKLHALIENNAKNAVRRLDGGGDAREDRVLLRGQLESPILTNVA